MKEDPRIRTIREGLETICTPAEVKLYLDAWKKFYGVVDSR